VAGAWALRCKTPNKGEKSMRNILRVAATVFALLVATDVASAQGGGGRGRGGPAGQRMADNYLTEITLDDAQKAKLAPIVVWYDSAAATLPQMGRGGGDTPPDTAAQRVAREARQKLTADYQAKIKAILTPEQVTKFEANIAAQAQRGRRGGGI
jgi:Spy/CpxP family protein refolding chaperone